MFLLLWLHFQLLAFLRPTWHILRTAPTWMLWKACPSRTFSNAGEGFCWIYGHSYLMIDFELPTCVLRPDTCWNVTFLLWVEFRPDDWPYLIHKTHLPPKWCLGIWVDESFWSETWVYRNSGNDDVKCDTLNVMVSYNVIHGHIIKGVLVTSFSFTCLIWWSVFHHVKCHIPQMFSIPGVSQH